MQYPHEALAGGSMYAFQLPSVIPPAGTPGGPPLPENYRDFAGSTFFGDLRLMFLNCIHDPATAPADLGSLYGSGDECAEERKGQKIGRAYRRLRQTQCRRRRRLV